MKKEKALERYDDAVAGGNAAVFAKRSKKDDTMTIKLGNLLPEQSATLKIHIIHSLDVVGGYYGFHFPVSFYPDNCKQGDQDLSTFVCQFFYQVKIISDGRISNLSIPESAEIVQQDETNTQVTVQSESTSRTLDLFYRTADMLVPTLVYAESPDKTEVACAVSMVPTFNLVEP